MAYYRKVYEITGYTGDAETWCVDCAKDRYGEPEDGGLEVVDREGNPVQPIFLSNEWDYQPHCCHCHEAIDVTVIRTREDGE